MARRRRGAVQHGVEALQGGAAAQACRARSGFRGLRAGRRPDLLVLLARVSGGSPVFSPPWLPGAGAVAPDSGEVGLNRL
jgi:hypothetical protein